MRNIDLVLVQNVIARITHGMVGFDLCLQGKGNNQYLSDFLSLKEDELKSAVGSASANTGFAPLSQEIAVKQGIEIISTVQRAQQLAKKIENTEPETISRTIAELEQKLNILYCGVIRR